MAITRNELKLMIKEELSKADVNMLQNPSKMDNEVDLYDAIKIASRALEDVVRTALPEYGGVSEEIEAACQNLRDALDTLSVRYPTHRHTSLGDMDRRVHAYENKSE
jgi:hypothetical protein|tara:strand:- start:3387 stop:3707 length:321 start_codon:yes stop_codon:yes gene_type:complete